MSAANARYPTTVRLRLLTERDLPDLMALKAAANWNQTERDWLLFLRYDPAGCFGIEVDGRVVASATSMCYGDELAWIGMVLTLPEYRGLGLARRVTQAAVEYAGNRVIKLDASDMGRPLYESMGFVAECAIDRWLRPPGTPVAEPQVQPLSYDPALDREVFGADRTILLKEFAEDEAASVPGGYAFGREGSNGPAFGPCVAMDPAAAETLLRWFTARHAHESIFIDLFPHHAEAVRIASSLGFAPLRNLTRMVLRPAEPQLPDARIYATGSFAWG